MFVLNLSHVSIEMLLPCLPNKAAIYCTNYVVKYEAAIFSTWMAALSSSWLGAVSC